MPILEKIIEWSKNLPDWKSDAIRRIFQGELSDEDKEEIYLLLKKEQGLDVETIIKAIPFASASPSRTSTTEKPLSLHKIHSLKNVNKLKDGENISFQHDGTTIIYGDNASGKSGYGRIFKRACRSRHDGGQILSNLFNEEFSTDFLAQASFDVEVDGKLTTIDWEDDDPQDYNLSRIAIFDKDTARIQVSDENEIDFLPYAADVLPTLVSLCDELNLDIQTEIENLSELPSDFDELKPDGQAGVFCKNLNLKTTKAQVDKITKLSDSEKLQYRKLRQIIIERENSDPKKLAEKHRRWSQKLTNLKEGLETLNEDLSDASFKQIISLNESFKTAEKATKLASKQDFSQEPLKGVGSNEWQLMFDAARKYAENVAYPQRKFEDTFNDRCVLCQQELKDDASKRLSRFNKFIKGDLKSKSKELEDKLLKETAFLINITLDPLKEQIEFKEYLESNHPILLSQINSFLKEIKLRHSIMTSGLKTGNWQKLNELADISDCLGMIQETSKQEIETAIALEKQEPTEKQKQQMIDYLNLKERLLLKKHKQSILDYISDLSVEKKLRSCEKALNTTSISRKQSSLLKEAVTDELLKSLIDELKILRVTTIKPKLDRSAKKGAVSHRIILDGMSAPEINLSGVLSEGEGLVVAIASFLAELALAPRFSVVVFDDPVCSLDHYWREKVAERLIALSKERQVIIFTHDILFLYELESQVNKQEPADKFLLKAMESRGDQAGVLLPDGELPFEILPVKKRVKHLRNRQQEAKGIFNQVGGDAEQYRKFVKSMYSSIRSSWERAVEEILFGDVVVRFRKSVQTLRLKDVATNITTEDCRFIEDEMTKCSEITDAHDTPGASRNPVPLPDDLLKDIEKLDAFRKEIDERRKK